MMARSGRLRIAKLTLTINFVPTFFCMAVFLTFHNPLLALLAYVQKRKSAELDELDMALVTLRRRAIDLDREMQQAHQLSEDRQDELLAACSEVSAESNACRASVDDAKRLPTTFVVLKPLLNYLNKKFARRMQKMLAFKEILSRIDSDTFYLDLLLWFLLPDAFSEALLGDLNEEYQIRKSTDGPVRARSWYRHQVAATVKDCLWRKIERLAAIGTLLDLLFRSHKK
jgi:hypothetical protein